MCNQSAAKREREGERLDSMYRILFIDLRYLFARDANHSAEFEYPRGFPPHDICGKGMQVSVIPKMAQVRSTRVILFKTDKN